MEEQKLSIKETVDRAKDYISVRKELIKLKAVEKGSRLFANLIADAFFIFIALIIFLFLSLGLAFYLSTVFNSYAIGFVSVAAFYLIFAIIMYLTKDKFLEKRIMNAFISKFFKD